MLFLLWRALICIFCNCSKRVAAGWSSECSRETIEADNFTLNSSGPTGEVRWSPLSSPSLQEDRVLGFSMVNCDKLLSVLSASPAVLRFQLHYLSPRCAMIFRVPWKWVTIFSCTWSNIFASIQCLICSMLVTLQLSSNYSQIERRTEILLLVVLLYSC